MSAAVIGPNLFTGIIERQCQRCRKWQSVYTWPSSSSVCSACRNASRRELYRTDPHDCGLRRDRSTRRRADAWRAWRERKQARVHTGQGCPCAGV